MVLSYQGEREGEKEEGWVNMRRGRDIWRKVGEEMGKSVENRSKERCG